MPKLYSKKAKKEADVDPVFVKEAVESGNFEYLAEEEYEFVDPDGESRLVKGSQAKRVGALGYRLFDDFDEDSRQEALRKEERYGGIDGAIAAGTLGILRGATLGGSDVALRAIAPNKEQVMQDLAGAQEINPGISTVTEVGGAVAGALTGAGVAGALAKGGAKVAGKLAAKGVPKALAQSAAFGLEGAVAGAGQAASNLAIHNKDITAEVLASEIWKGAKGGALLGAGSGLLVGSVSALGKTLGKRRFRPTSFKTPRGAELTTQLEASQQKLSSVLEDIKAAGNQPRTQIQRGSLAQRLRRIDETMLQVEDAAADTALVSELRASRKALKRKLGDNYGSKRVSRAKTSQLADDVARFEEQANNVARNAGIEGEYELIKQSLPSDAVVRKAAPKGPIPQKLTAKFTPEALEDFSKADFNQALKSAKQIDSELTALGQFDDGAAREIHKIDRSLGRFTGDKDKSVSELLNEMGLERAAQDVSELGPVGDKLVRLWAAQREDLVTTVAKATKEATKKIGSGVDAAAQLVPGPTIVKKAAKGLIESSIGIPTLPLAHMDKGFNLIRKLVQHGQSAETRLGRAAQAFKKGSRKTGAIAVGQQHRKILDTISGTTSRTTDQAFEKARNFLTSSAQAPDTFDADAGELLRPVALADPEIAAKARTQHVQSLNYLKDHLPKNPFPGRITNYEPHRSEKASFARRARGVLDPIGTLEAVARGEVLAEAVEAIAETRPALYMHFQQELLSNVDELAKLSSSRKQLLAALFHVPITATNLPDILAQTQIQFAAANEPTQPTLTRAVPRDGARSETTTQQIDSGV